MTKDSKKLLASFAKLLQNRYFINSIMIGARFGDHGPQHRRGGMRLLQLLAEEDKLTNTDIVEKLDIRPSSVSAMISKLEESGFVTKEDSQEDKRVTYILLTEKGKSLVNSAQNVGSELADSMFKDLSEDEQEKLLEIIDKLSKNLESRADDGSLDDEFKKLFSGFEGFHGHAHGPFGGHQPHGPVGPGRFGWGGPRGRF